MQNVQIDYYHRLFLGFKIWTQAQKNSSNFLVKPDFFVKQKLKILYSYCYIDSIFNTCWKSRQNPTDGAKKPQGRLSPPTICLAAKNWTNQNRREALFVEGAGDGFKTALALLVENGDPSMY